MDVAVANLSNGQRKIAKFEEKTKNEVQYLGKNVAGIAALTGTGVLAVKSDGAKDVVKLMGKDGFKPTVSQKILARIDDTFGKAYDNVSEVFKKLGCKEKISNFVDELKEMSNNEKGAALATAVVGLATIGISIASRIKHDKKDAQIEQKYN